MKNILGTTGKLSLYSKKRKLLYCFKVGASNKEAWTEAIYDEIGNMLSYKDSMGLCKMATYNERGLLLTYDNSDGGKHILTYDLNGKTLTHKNSSGYSAEWTRDSKGNELTYENSLGEKRGFAVIEYTMEELTKILGDFKIKL